MHDMTCNAINWEHFSLVPLVIEVSKWTRISIAIRFFSDAWLSWSRFICLQAWCRLNVQRKVSPARRRLIQYICCSQFPVQPSSQPMPRFFEEEADDEGDEREREEEHKRILHNKGIGRRAAPTLHMQVRVWIWVWMARFSRERSMFRSLAKVLSIFRIEYLQGTVANKHFAGFVQV